MPSRKRFLYIAGMLAAFPVMGCAASGIPAGGWSSTQEDRPKLGDLVVKASAGNKEAWRKISHIWNTYPLDAATAETFSAGMGELFARNPVVFLDEYLAGDKNAVDLLRVGWVSYGESFNPNYHGEDICRAARTLFLARAQVGRPAERDQAQQFVNLVFEPGSAKIRVNPYPRQPRTARWPKTPPRPSPPQHPT